MRIGYVLKRYPRFSETFIVNEILALEAAGLAIEIFSLRPPNDTHFQDAIARVRAPVHYLLSDGLKAGEFWTAMERTCERFPGCWTALETVQGEEVSDVYQALRLACEAQQGSVTHLHAHFATAAATVARLAARIANVPYTVTAHAKDIFHGSVRREDLERKFGDAAAVITVSDYNVEFLRTTLGLRAASIERVYNGLDLREFPYHIPDDRPPLIVAVGRLVEKKGFVDLIDACATLASRNIRPECEIIGTGPLEAELRDRIECLGLAATVHLLGPIPRREVVQRIREASLLAAPCVVGSDGNRDGLPTVVLEAMALGTPCVSTDVTGIPEVLRDEQTGLLVSQHAPVLLAVAIERLLLDPALRVRLAMQARRLIEDQFDIRDTSAQLRAIFEAARRDRTEASVVR